MDIEWMPLEPPLSELLALSERQAAQVRSAMAIPADMLRPDRTQMALAQARLDFEAAMQAIRGWRDDR